MSARKKPGVIAQVGIIVICALFFVAGYFGADYIIDALKKPVTYKSTKANFSLMYPGKWKKANNSDFGLVNGLGMGGLLAPEVIVADGSNEDDMKNFLAVGSISTMGTSWQQAVAGWRDAFSKPLPVMPAGTTMTPGAITDTTVAGRPALSIKLEMAHQGTKYDCDITMFGAGARYVMMAFLSKNPGGSMKEFRDIVESVKIEL